jgi:hypothetical protein
MAGVGAFLQDKPDDAELKTKVERVAVQAAWAVNRSHAQKFDPMAFDADAARARVEKVLADVAGGTVFACVPPVISGAPPDYGRWVWLRGGNQQGLAWRLMGFMGRVG